MSTKTPITLITGSLGSGKTTLLQHIIRTTDQRLAVVMNEFGEIAIDSRIIEGENIQMIELAGGCVCCELTGEFQAAVQELLKTVSPDHIVVEATGVAESDALVYEVEESLPEVRLDSVVYIVDADLAVRFPQIGYAERTQLACADIILVNKIDLVDDRQLDAIIPRIREINATPAIIRTVRGAVDTQMLFGPSLRGAAQRAARPAEHDSEHRHTERFQSFVYSGKGLLNRACFEQVADALGSSVLRAKGFICTPEGGLLFNQVAGRWELEPFESGQTRLVFIGQNLEAEKTRILQHLKQCEH